MATEVWGMLVAGLAALLAGLALVRQRMAAPSGVDRVLLLGPVMEATALAIFAAEHFLAARELMGIVPRWLPGPLFWTYLVGVALLSAAVSFLVWRHVDLSALLLATLFLIIVATIDLPALQTHFHERLFWILTARETCFAGGAMVLAGSQGLHRRRAKEILTKAGRFVVAAVFVFYAAEHFLFPRYVPGVPLEKPIPAWFPVPVLLSWLVGAVLLFAGIGLMRRSTFRAAAAVAGTVLLMLTVFFYVPILVTEIRSPLAVEGVNYVGDTLLFAATALLAGFARDVSAEQHEREQRAI